MLEIQELIRMHPSEICESMRLYLSLSFSNVLFAVYQLLPNGPESGLYQFRVVYLYVWYIEVIDFHVKVILVFPYS